MPGSQLPGGFKKGINLAFSLKAQQKTDFGSSC